MFLWIRVHFVRCTQSNPQLQTTSVYLYTHTPQTRTQRVGLNRDNGFLSHYRCQLPHHYQDDCFIAYDYRCKRVTVLIMHTYILALTGLSLSALFCISLLCDLTAYYSLPSHSNLSPCMPFITAPSSQKSL